jgi:arabinogalactan oligomer/maltooligosaccharide transport system substrate-binding protein
VTPQSIIIVNHQQGDWSTLAYFCRYGRLNRCQLWGVAKRIIRSFLLTCSFMIFVAIVNTACSPNSGTATQSPQVITPIPSEEPTEKPTQEPTGVQESVESEEINPSDQVNIALPCTISLWHSFNENEIKSLLDISAAFKEIYPEVEFDFLYTPNYDLKGKFKDEALVGGGPSILIGSAEWGPTLYELGLIQDVSGLAEDELLDLINPNALGSVQYGDALIGLPLNIKGVLLFRNSEIITQAPGSFEELIDLAQAATAGDIIGADLDYGLFYSAGHLFALGGNLMDEEGIPAFNDEKGVEWMEELKRFNEAGLVDFNGDNDFNLFLESRVGFIIDVLSNAAVLAEAIGPENLEIDPWPKDMSGFVQSDGIYLNSNLTGQDLECGWSFMEFLLSPDSQGVFSDPTMANFVPALIDLELIDPHQKQASIAFTDGIPFPVIPEMSAYWDPLNNALLSVVEFGSDPAEALLIAEESVNANLEEPGGD